MTPTPTPDKIPKSQRRSTEAAATDYVSLVSEKVDAGFEKLAAAQERTELALVQLTSQVKQTSVNLDKLDTRLDKMADRIDGHLAIATQQAANIEHLSALVASQSRIVEMILNRAS